MVTLFIARHGQTEENVRRILQGQMPGHLTEEGIEQAKMLRDSLRDTHFDCIMTSDLLRAVDTARIISAPHGGRFRLEPLLRERNFGIHTGGPYIKIGSTLDSTAETMEQLAARALAFLQMLSCEYDGKQVLAVSHGLFLRVLQSVLYGVDLHDVEKMNNAEVRKLSISQVKREADLSGVANAFYGKEY